MLALAGSCPERVTNVSPSDLAFLDTCIYSGAASISLVAARLHFQLRRRDFDIQSLHERMNSGRNHARRGNLPQHAASSDIQEALAFIPQLVPACSLRSNNPNRYTPHKTFDIVPVIPSQKRTGKECMSKMRHTCINTEAFCT